MQRLRDRYFRWLIRRRLFVLGLSGAVVTAAALMAGRVSIDYTMEQFFPGWGPERERYDQYKLSFPKEDTQISLFWKEGRALDVALYREMERAAEFFVEVGLEDVTWLGSVDVAEVAEVDGYSGIGVHPLIEEDKLSDHYIHDVLVRYRDEPLYRGFLWNEDQSVFAVHGVLDQHLMDDDRRRREIEEELTQWVSDAETDGAELALSGLPIIRSRIPKYLDEDQRLLVSLGLVVFLAVFFLFFRHIGQVVLCLVSVIPAYLCTVGLIGLLGKSVTILTGFIPIIILVVGGSDIVHVLSRYRRARVHTLENYDAVVSAFSELAVPCFYTSLTTAIGFLSLVGTRIGIIMDFGAFTAIAIFLTYAFTMTTLPVLLSLYTRKTFDDRGLEAAWLRKSLDVVAALAARPSRNVALLFATVAVLAVGLGARVRVDAYLVDDLKDDTDIIRDIRWIESNGFGLFQVNLHLQQLEGEPLHHPDALRWVQEFQSLVRDEPLVVSSFALPDYLSSLRRAALDGSSEDRALPATLEEASQLVFLAQLEDADFFADVYKEVDGEGQVIVLVRDEGSAAMLPLLQRIEGYLERNPPPVGHAASTGTVKLIMNYTAQVLKNFGPSLIIAVILIFAVMSFMFRSVRHGLLALVPNLFPLLVLLGLMGIAGFDLKPSTILVFSIAFGIAVDDTIHVLGRFRTIVAEGHEVRPALVQAVRDSGPAVLMTSVVVSTGFATLMASRFEVLFLVGLMTTVSAVAAVAADLLVFPAIMTVAWRRVEREPMPSGRIVEA